MKIKCYRTTAYQNIDTYETDHIDGTPPPEEMDDELREAL